MEEIEWLKAETKRSTVARLQQMSSLCAMLPSQVQEFAKFGEEIMAGYVGCRTLPAV